MTNILHLIDTTGPGGAETVFIDLLRELDPSKYHHTVVLRGEGWVADQVRGLGIEPLILNSKGSFNFRYVLSLCKLIRAAGIDLIHSHLLGSNVYGAMAALLCRRPLIATFHGSVDVASGERFLAAKFGLINLGANAIIGVSRKLMKDLGSRSSLSPGKQHLIYNGVDENRFSGESPSTLRSELGLREEDTLILSVGNIRPAKGYTHLVEAAARLVQKDASYQFVVVGHEKQPLAGELRDKAKALGVQNNLHFLGFRDDVSELMGQADVYLLPSISEGFSISTVEAMMAGVPVLATKSGGPEEILESGVSGLLVPVADPDAIVEGIGRLRDQAFASRLREAARKSARERFSMRAMIQSYESLYQELLA